MAKVTGINLDTIKKLGKVLQFGHCRGRIYVRGKQPSLPKPHTRIHKRSTDAFKCCNTNLKTLDATVRNSYIKWAAPSDYTWKDLFTSRFLRTAHAAGQPPIVIKKIETERDGSDIKASYLFGHYFILPHTGYGSLPWGSSPYGARSTFANPQGAPLIIDYFGSSCHPPPPPRPDPTKPLPLDRDCATPADPDTIDQVGPDTIPAGTMEVDLTALTGFERYAISDRNSNCIATENQAWARYISDPTITQQPPSFEFRTHKTIIKTATRYRTSEFSRERTGHLQIPAMLAPPVWPVVTNIYFLTTNDFPTDMAPWAPTLRLFQETQTILKAQTQYDFTPPHYNSTFAWEGSQNESQPPSHCPQDFWINNNKCTLDGKAYIEHDEFICQSEITVPLPGIERPHFRIDQAPGYPPVLCPPTEVQ